MFLRIRWLTYVYFKRTYFCGWDHFSDSSLYFCKNSFEHIKTLRWLSWSKVYYIYIYIYISRTINVKQFFFSAKNIKYFLKPFLYFFSQNPRNWRKLIPLRYIGFSKYFNKFNDANCTSFFECQRLLP